MHRSRARWHASDASHGVIVGTAIGYGFPQIEEFLKSLRRSGYRGEIVMTLARTLPQGDREWLSRFGVTPYFVRESPWIAPVTAGLPHSALRGALHRVIRTHTARNTSGRHPAGSDQSPVGTLPSVGGRVSRDLRTGAVGVSVRRPRRPFPS